MSDAIFMLRLEQRNIARVLNVIEDQLARAGGPSGEQAIDLRGRGAAGRAASPAASRPAPP